MRSITVAVALLALSFMAVLNAQAPVLERRGICGADADRFCREPAAAGAGMWMCLRAHDRELSPACTEHMNMLRERMGEFVKSCRGDRQVFCRNMRPGDGKIITCLKANINGLSDECRMFFQKY